MRRHLALALVLLAAASTAPLPPLPAQDDPGARPNIVLILADDMGYSDIGCFGSEIETPHLDALAAGGLRYTQCYNGARCCPTRASLLTGLYAHQTGIGHMVDSGRAGPGYQCDLNGHCVTIAEVLRQADYRTYMAGKWHVTPLNPRGDDHDRKNWPLQRGFDRFYGTIHGAGSFYDPKTLARDNDLISPFADPLYEPDDGFYYTDAISDHAERFVRDHHRSHGDRPFFLYVSYTAAHWPMHARERDIAKYRGRYRSGFEAVRARRFEKQQQLGVVDGDWPLSPAPIAWADARDQQFEQQCMEVYAAMVDSMDQGIGRLVRALRETGELDDTLILYLQDNGGCAERYGRHPHDEVAARPHAPTLPPMAATELQRDMQPAQTRDGYPVRTGYGVRPGAADTYIAYGRGWANVSNTPFREYKHWVHEGGISTPLIAHWPNGIADRGRIRGDVCHLIDVMATAIDVASADYPTERDGERTHPPEGVSLRATFAGEALQRSTPVFFEHEGNRAARDGRWKVVAKGAGGAWQLHDMVTDRVEHHDVSQQHPEIARRLIEAWERWAERCHVVPWPHRPAYESPLDR